MLVCQSDDAVWLADFKMALNPGFSKPAIHFRRCDLCSNMSDSLHTLGFKSKDMRLWEETQISDGCGVSNSVLSQDSYQTFFHINVR